MQVWTFLLILVGLLVLVAIVGGVVFLVYRAGQRQQAEDIITVKTGHTAGRRQKPLPSRGEISYRRGYQQIQSYQQFWGQITNFKTRGDLLNLSTAQFEEICGDLLQLLGYTNVEHVGGPGDLGVDLRATDPTGKSTIVQCKRHGIGNPANSKEYRELLGAMKQHSAERGIFFTTSDFTTPVVRANTESDPDITLINGEKLVQLIHQTASMQS